MKQKISEYLVQAVLIIFSVVLALILNEYINNIKTKKEVAIIVENIEEELQANKEIVEELIPYHQEVLRKIELTTSDSLKLDSIKSSTGLQLSTIAPHGIYQKIVSQTAWEVAKMSGLMSEIDNKVLQLLSKTYEQQKITFSPAEQIIEILASREYLDPTKAKENLTLMYWQFNEIKGREESLQRFYSEALEELNDQ